jgi:hypothetical protein
MLFLPVSIGHNAYGSAQLMRDSPEASGRGFVYYSTGSSWIPEHTDPGEVMTHSPLERHLYFRRPVVEYGNLAGLADRIQTFKVSYLFVGPSSPDYPDRLDSGGQAVLSMLRQAAAEEYQLVYEQPQQQVFVYQVMQRTTP